MGEFNNDVFGEMVEQLNINIKTTAAESPWYNGIEKQWYKIIPLCFSTIPLDQGDLGI